MTATALTFCLFGLDAYPLTVAVTGQPGPARFDLVGLPEASARESRVRVRAALLTVGVELDGLQISVTLTSDSPSLAGWSFDVAIAVGVLAALGRIPGEALTGTAILGELSLAGEIRPVRGVLPMLRHAHRHGVQRAIVPLANAAEAAHVTGLELRAASDLAAVLAHFRGEQALPPALARNMSAPSESWVDLAELGAGHPASRALEIAAAGGHNLLLMGPPSCGKTMAARRLPTLLPPLSLEEALEVTAIHSVGSLIPSAGIINERPFRAPHHTVSEVGMLGGGDPVRPGEVSLAHRGCLFLDDIAEFRRSVLNSLRQPFEGGAVTICRARRRTTFPAKPLFVAASNPCPCGFFGDGSTRCQCAAERVRAYRSRVPIDLFDLQVTLPPIANASVSREPGETSRVVRERVIRAREAQLARADHNKTETRLCWYSEGLIRDATLAFGLSSRRSDMVRRVARTIADLDGRDAILIAHVAEAISLLPKAI